MIVVICFIVMLAALFVEAKLNPKPPPTKVQRRHKFKVVKKENK